MLFSTPSAGSAVSARARVIATCGSSQPRIGDQRVVDATPGARRCGSNTATGRSADARAAKVTARLSGRVEVVITAPGASRIIGMTTCRPLPERGGPSSTIESSTDAQQVTPRDDPSAYPTSLAGGWVRDGRSVAALRSSAFSPAATTTSRRDARPGMRVGSFFSRAASTRHARHAKNETAPMVARNAARTVQ